MRAGERDEELVHHAILERAARSPETLAVADPGGTLRYGELARVSGRLANRLRRFGVGPDERVAVCLEASRELVVAHLGVLRAGGAYVPIDPGSPDDRVRFLLEDSGARALLTGPTQRDRFRGVCLPVVEIGLDESFLGDESEESPDTGVGPENLVYVVYTSGSTGLPKGVLVEHRNLANLLDAYHRRLGITAADRSAMVAGVAFDAAVVDLWPYLTRGGSLHVPPRDVRMDPRALARWLIETGIDVASLPTGLGEAVLRQDWSGSDRLRVFLVGGEALRRPPSQPMPFRVINSYGPTECTVDTTWYVLPATVDPSAPVPIGRPLEGYRVHVVGAEGEEVPHGAVGELWVGGAGVARGYLGRADLTDEKFVPDRFATSGGGRLYRTGDLVRYREDGELEFHGRIDDQVQIRGHRVEPGEVATVLSTHPAVGAIEVFGREDDPGRVRLVAYVQPVPGATDPLAELRALAEKRLPAYMVPTFVLLDALPRTLNGKVDRSALPRPEEQATSVPREVAEPGDELEACLLEVWRRELRRDDVGVDEGFFELGGDSLSVVAMLAAVESEVGVEIPLPELMRDPTVVGLARWIRAGAPSDVRPTVVPLRTGGRRSPFFCVAGAGGGCHWFGELAKSLRHDRPFLGLEPVHPEGGDGSLESMADALEAEVLRAQASGPYFLGGYSSGGVLAFEIAQRLRARGQEVALLALIEADGGREFTTRLGQFAVFARNLLRLEPSRMARVLLDRASFALEMIRTRLARAGDAKSVSARIEARRRDDEAALFGYVPLPYGGDVHVFACEDRPMTAVVDEAYGWGEIVRGRLVIREVPGNHYTMLGLPNVSVLARELQRALDDAESREERKRSAVGLRARETGVTSADSAHRDLPS